MGSWDQIERAVIESFDTLFAKAVAFLPQMVGAIALIVVGWLLARLLRALTLRLARGVGRFAGALGFEDAMASDRVRSSSIRFVAMAVYWTVILVFVTIATNLLGLELFAAWLDALVGYLPNLVAGIVIILVGSLLAGGARGAVMTLAGDLPPEQRLTLGRAAQIITLVTAAIVAVNQIGIDVGLINTIVAVVAAAFLGGLSIAFSLGARGYVGNLMGVRYLGDDYRIGERIRVAGVDGTIAEITTTAVILDTAEGRMRVPGKMFDESSSLVVSGAS